MRTYVIAFVLIAIAVLLGIYVLNTKQSPDNQVACTQEALLCPDGSYVGRSGPQCQFSACPNIQSLTGLLEFKNDTYRLIIDAPPSDAQGVSYAVPLQVSTGTDTSEFVKKKITVFGTFTAGNTFSVSRFEALPDRQSNPTLGSVSVGKTVYINGVRVTLNKIISDNRCPRNVVCIVAGAVKADISLRSDTDSETREISSDQKPVGFDSYQISIKDVQPDALSTRSIAPDDYIITIQVVAN